VKEYLNEKDEGGLEKKIGETILKLKGNDDARKARHER
jgi:hypothetical protein